MKPGKKGEMYSSVIKYILMAFFSLVVLVAGFKGITFIRDMACNAELANFEIELSGIDKELRFGVKELKDFRIPCKTGQIYFFDLGKKINPDDFNSLPLIKNAIATNSSKNVFIVDRGKVKKSFYAGNMEAIYPYYLCLKPKFDRISFFAEGRENSAFLTAACGQPDCTLIPINITESEAQRIIQEAVYSQFGCDKCKYDYALENIKSTKEKVELFRRFIVCNGITKVEIVIRPKKGAEVTNFRYYEYIPKECVDDLSSYLQELELEDNVIVQKNDPLIVWHFDEIEDETVLSYELSKEFGELCRRIIEGLGVVKEIQGAVPPQPVCGDDLCNGLETCSTCSIDCGACLSTTLPVCGDTYCEGLETCSNCPIDCGSCPASLPIIPPASQPAPTPTIPAQCQGGIPLGCDPVIQPRKCVALGNGQYDFVNDCQTCNCPPGWNCEGNGNCGAPATSNQCSDGTLRGECSNTKPLECRSNLVLSANAGRCGCPSGERQEDDDCVPDGQAQPTQSQPSPICIENYQKRCGIGGDRDKIFLYDSCGNQGDIYYDCKSNCGPWYAGGCTYRKDSCKDGQCCLKLGDSIWDCEDPFGCTPQCIVGEKRCQPGVTNIVEECQSVNNCPIWVPQSCGLQTCQNGECQSPTTGGQASLSARARPGNIQQQGSRTYYYYTSTITETSGGRVTVNSRRKCYQVRGDCDDWKYDISQYYGTNVIEPYGSISNSGNFFGISGSFTSETVTETFLGTDETGQQRTASYTISTNDFG